MEVPQFEGVIEGGDEDELSVRGELGEGDRRGLVINEGLEAGACVSIPYAAGAIMASRDNDGSVANKMDRGDRIGMAGDGAEAAAGLNVPQAEGAIEGAGDDEIGLGVEVDAEDEVRVAAERLDALPSEGIPDAEGSVVGSRADVVGVGRPGEVADALGMAVKAVKRDEGLGGPND